MSSKDYDAPAAAARAAGPGAADRTAGGPGTVTVTRSAALRLSPGTESAQSPESRSDHCPAATIGNMPVWLQVRDRAAAGGPAGQPRRPARQ